MPQRRCQWKVAKCSWAWCLIPGPQRIGFVFMSYIPVCRCRKDWEVDHHFLSCFVLPKVHETHRVNDPPAGLSVRCLLFPPFDRFGCDLTGPWSTVRCQKTWVDQARPAALPPWQIGLHLEKLVSQDSSSCYLHLNLHVATLCRHARDVKYMAPITQWQRVQYVANMVQRAPYMWRNMLSACLPLINCHRIAWWPQAMACCSSSWAASHVEPSRCRSPAAPRSLAVSDSFGSTYLKKTNEKAGWNNLSWSVNLLLSSNFQLMFTRNSLRTGSWSRLSCRQISQHWNSQWKSAVPLMKRRAPQAVSPYRCPCWFWFKKSCRKRGPLQGGHRSNEIWDIEKKTYPISLC